MKLNIGDEIIEEKYLRKWSSDHLTAEEDWIRNIAVSLLDWYGQDFMNIYTSGSTGRPKLISHSKNAVIQSAQLTASYLGLKPGMTALNVLPAQYIAGRMMLYRALVLDMDITCVAPKLHLAQQIEDTQKYFEFSAMTPLQVSTILDASKSGLDTIASLIIGGASVSTVLLERLQGLSTRCFATYGMTETITHVAMKSLNRPKESYFKALPGIEFRTEDDCLVIHANHLDNRKITTNDIVTLKDKFSFVWKGRKDNVINRGGVKLHPEELEQKLRSLIQERFFIAKRASRDVGEEPILIIEGQGSEGDYQALIDLILPKLSRPADIYWVHRLKETPTGKIIRDIDQYELAN